MYFESEVRDKYIIIEINSTFLTSLKEIYILLFYKYHKFIYLFDNLIMHK